MRGLRLDSARMRLDLVSEADLPLSLGRYTLTRLLGEGGMARVFAGEVIGELGFRKPAAIKVVLPAPGPRREELQRQLVQEARVGGLLNHPNVAQTFDCGTLDGFPYIAMELVEGMGLHQLVEAGGPLSIGAALDLVEQTCAGLHHAHTAVHRGRELRVVHRDVKPSNLLVRSDGVVKIVDFGIAKAAVSDSEITATGMTKGTPSYMSPEQLEARPVDARSDLFTLGAVLYYALTGRLLFGGSSLTEVMMRIVRVDETLAEQGTIGILERLVPGLGPVFVRLMRRDREQRHPDAATLGEDIGRLRRALPPSGPTLGETVAQRSGLLLSGLGAPRPVPRPPPRSDPSPRWATGPADPSGAGPTRAMPAAHDVPEDESAWLFDDEPAPLPSPTRDAAAPAPPLRPRRRRARGRGLLLIVLGGLVGAVLVFSGFALLRKLSQEQVAVAELSPAGAREDPGARPRPGDRAPSRKRASDARPASRGASPTPVERARPAARPTPKPASSPSEATPVARAPEPTPGPAALTPRGAEPTPSPAPIEAKPTPSPAPVEAKPTPSAAPVEAKPTPPELAPEGAEDPAPTPWKRRDAEPTPGPDPVEQKPAPTPRPTPAEERTAEAPPTRGLAIKHGPVGRGILGTSVELRVAVDGPPDTRVVVRFGPPGGPYRRLELAAQGGGQWVGSFLLADDLAQGAEYWIVATHAQTQPRNVFSGSRSTPHAVKVY